MVLKKQKKTATRKGYIALAGAVITPLLWWKLSWIAGAAGLGATAFLAFDWIRYRARWGLKF